MRVWVGYHPRIGVVIYDPTYQAGTDDTQVRLWDVNKRELKLFERTRVRQSLCSLKAHLIASGLEPLVNSHGIVGQVAKRYFQSQPPRPTEPYARTYWGYDPAWSDYDPEGETKRILDEISEDQDAWARSEEEGWFYED